MPTAASYYAATLNERPLLFSTFFVADLFFGIEVRSVREVMGHQEMTNVPLAPPVIEGLINLRGQIITALDMRRRLSLPSRPPEVTAMNVAVRSDEGAVSLLVDEIGDVLEVPREAFEEVPDNVLRDFRDLIKGLYQLDGLLLLALNVDRVLHIGCLQSA
jgi:purine-binding chemotaxis protein CheW